MKMLLVGFAFAGALTTSGSGASATRLDHPASAEATRPIPVVSYTDKTRPTPLVDYQLSNEERTLLAFLRLRAAAERDAR